MIKHSYLAMQPIYPLLVQQFIDDYDLSDGVACDIGTGPGFLGLELAKASNMKIIFLDIDEGALSKAKDTFESIEADNEVEFVLSPVEKIALPDESVDFVMSRGSVFFWDDVVAGIKEIYRILKPGGVAVVGGGLGRYMPDTMRKRILNGMRARLKRAGETRPSLEEFKKMMMQANIKNSRVFDDGEGKGGRWFEIRKD